jgi:hypothetical protein
MEINMKIQTHAVAFLAAMGVFSLAPAEALYFDDTRPPPNGMNGVSLNGLSANGLSANGLSANGLSANGLSANGLSANGQSTAGHIVGTATIRSVVLKDGSRVDLR